MWRTLGGFLQGRQRLLRWVCVAGAGLLSACATVKAPPMTTVQETATYVARAKPSYAPPGPPGDPWGPYIVEASKRFDVPQTWVRAVMRVESNGMEFRPSGVLVTSPVGAMGLMQLMPQTYDEVRARYGLGDDAFEPHNNILAGTAYLREMYDTFGSPGFLAAYNAGPARLVDYLSHNRALPDETRRYVAMIAPKISGVWPQSRSPAEQYAANQLPVNIPAGPRYARHKPVLLAARGKTRVQAVRVATSDQRHHSSHGPAPVELAEAPEPRVTRLASASAPGHHGGLGLIKSAMASEVVTHEGGSSWAIQVGAYGNAQDARAAASSHAVGHVHPVVAVLKTGHATLYRARVSGFTHAAAVQACQKLAHACMVVSPAANS